MECRVGWGLVVVVVGSQDAGHQACVIMVRVIDRVHVMFELGCPRDDKRRHEQADHDPDKPVVAQRVTDAGGQGHADRLPREGWVGQSRAWQGALRGNGGSNLQARMRGLAGLHRG